MNDPRRAAPGHVGEAAPAPPPVPGAARRPLSPDRLSKALRPKDSRQRPAGPPVARCCEGPWVWRAHAVPARVLAGGAAIGPPPPSAWPPHRRRPRASSGKVDQEGHDAEGRALPLQRDHQGHQGHASTRRSRSVARARRRQDLPQERHRRVDADRRTSGLGEEGARLLALPAAADDRGRAAAARPAANRRPPASGHQARRRSHDVRLPAPTTGPATCCAARATARRRPTSPRCRRSATPDGSSSSSPASVIDTSTLPGEGYHAWQAPSPTRRTPIWRVKHAHPGRHHQRLGAVPVGPHRLRGPRAVEQAPAAHGDGGLLGQPLQRDDPRRRHGRVAARTTPYTIRTPRPRASSPTCCARSRKHPAMLTYLNNRESTADAPEREPGPRAPRAAHRRRRERLRRDRRPQLRAHPHRPRRRLRLGRVRRTSRGTTGPAPVKVLGFTHANASDTGGEAVVERATSPTSRTTPRRRSGSPSKLAVALRLRQRRRRRCQPMLANVLPQERHRDRAGAARAVLLARSSRLDGREGAHARSSTSSRPPGSCRSGPRVGQPRRAAQLRLDGRQRRVTTRSASRSPPAGRHGRRLGVDGGDAVRWNNALSVVAGWYPERRRAPAALQRRGRSHPARRPTASSSTRSPTEPVRTRARRPRTRRRCSPSSASTDRPRPLSSSSRRGELAACPTSWRSSWTRPTRPCGEAAMTRRPETPPPTTAPARRGRARRAVTRRSLLKAIGVGTVAVAAGPMVGMRGAVRGRPGLDRRHARRPVAARRLRRAVRRRPVGDPDYAAWRPDIAVPAAATVPARPDVRHAPGALRPPAVLDTRASSRSCTPPA